MSVPSVARTTLHCGTRRCGQSWRPGVRRLKDACWPRNGSPDPGLDDIAENALGAELPDDAQTAGRGHRSPPAWRPEEAYPPQDTPPQQLPDDAGRWAVADRAVDDASLALFQAGRKISRAQDLVRAAAAADDADEEVWRASPAGDLADAEDAITALLSTTDAQREMLAQLLTTTGGGGLVDRPRVALTDALSGALL